MRVNTNELRVPFDVDQTLVMYCSLPEHCDVLVVDPYTGEDIFLRVHKKHVALLKSHKARGYEVTVWSANGHRWAEAVVRALDLVQYVDVVEGKFFKFVDDLEAHEVLGQRVYINE